MHPEIEAAYELMSAGDVAEAEARLEVALRAPSLTAADRAHALARLSSCYRLAGKRADALRTARDASVIAVVCDDDRAAAVADFMLGNAAIDVFFADHAAAEIMIEGMQALERAADRYQQLGAIDFASVLLTMAEVARGCGELDAACTLYTRVLRELDDARWSERDDIAQHLNGVRARCFVGLGAVAVAGANAAEAVTQFELAIEHIIAAPDPGSPALLEDIALAFEQLGDRKAAARARTTARSISTAP